METMTLKVHKSAREYTYTGTCAFYSFTISYIPQAAKALKTLNFSLTRIGHHLSLDRDSLYTCVIIVYLYAFIYLFIQSLLPLLVNRKLPWGRRRSAARTEWQCWQHRREVFVWDGSWTWVEWRTPHSRHGRTSVAQQPYHPHPRYLYQYQYSAASRYWLRVSYNIVWSGLCECNEHHYASVTSIIHRASLTYFMVDWLVVS